MLTLSKCQLCGIEIGEDVTAGNAGVVLEVPTRLTFRGGERCERVEPTTDQKHVSLHASTRIQGHQPCVEEI